MPRQDTVVVRGRITEPVDGGIIRYAAPAPCARMLSFSGSGLPHPNLAQGLSNTPNHGTAKVGADGSYAIELVRPCAFYRDMCGTYVPPTVFVSYRSGGHERAHEVIVGDGIPFRTLTYDARRTGPLFYRGRRPLPVRDQEAVVRASAFPACGNGDVSDFWGDAVPNA